MRAKTEAQEVGERIEALLGMLAEHAVPEVAGAAEELAELLMDMYGAGLERILELLGEQPEGAEQLRRVISDELVSGLLVLHDLHPDDTATRADRALESVRPYLGSHAGDVDLIGVVEEDGGPVVKLALKGSCDGCPSSAITVKTAIEAALAKACPEVIRVDVDGVTSPAAVAPPDVTVTDGKELPLLQIGSRPPLENMAASWVVLEPPGLQPGQCAVIDVEGHPVLFAVPDGASSDLSTDSGGLVAYQDRCPSCLAASLDGAVLVGDRLSCPSCESIFDVRKAGRAIAGGTSLQPLPLVTRAGGLRLALPRAPAGLVS
jgi:Fe-S cluster biogenesis protein NfuA/nitrite reductase/ring-hydroxylating ferredoxin subunit